MSTDPTIQLTILNLITKIPTPPTTSSKSSSSNHYDPCTRSLPGGTSPNPRLAQKGEVSNKNGSSQPNANVNKPLHDAVIFEDIKKVQSCMQANSPDGPNHDGDNPFHDVQDKKNSELHKQACSEIDQHPSDSFLSPEPTTTLGVPKENEIEESPPFFGSSSEIEFSSDDDSDECFVPIEQSPPPLK